MLVTREPVLRKYWYPVAFARAVDDGPVHRRLHGEDLVLWRAGTVTSAASDRCPHRDANLSRGQVCDGRLVCPYHGWEFGSDGAVARIPQLEPGAALPTRGRLACTPEDDRRTRLLQQVLRNDTESDRPSADIVAFDDKVEAEDQAVLDRLPADYPLDPASPGAHARRPAHPRVAPLVPGVDSRRLGPRAKACAEESLGLARPVSAMTGGWAD